MAELKIETEHDLVSIAPKPPDLYSSESLPALTTYSLYWLHTWDLRRSIEVVAVLNWRLFPEKYSMFGFEQFPDALRTNRSLLQGQPKYRNLLTGSATKGFSLNSRGFELAGSLIESLGVPETTSGEKAARRKVPPSKKLSPPRSLEPAHEVRRAKRSKLFQKWKDSVLAERDIIHLYSLLDIFDHTPVKVRNQRTKALQRYADELEDAEFAKFITDVRSLFAGVFRQ